MSLRARQGLRIRPALRYSNAKDVATRVVQRCTASPFRQGAISLQGTGRPLVPVLMLEFRPNVAGIAVTSLGPAELPDSKRRNSEVRNPRAGKARSFVPKNLSWRHASCTAGWVNGDQVTDCHCCQSHPDRVQRARRKRYIR